MRRLYCPAALQTEGESNPLKFSQVFHLMPVGTSFVVTNGGGELLWLAWRSRAMHQGCKGNRSHHPSLPALHCWCCCL